MSSGSQRESRGRGLDEVVREGMMRESSSSSSSSSSNHDSEASSTRRDEEQGPQTRRTSQMSEVSRMSSRWSEQRSSVALRLPALFRMPVGVARGSGRGIMG